MEQAARRCCDNPYYAFHKPAGTSLICIQGDWSNVVDAKIKGRLAAAMGVDSKSPYSPLYARAVGTPKPWGVTALFAEYTGTHAPLDVDWSLERGARPAGSSHSTVSEPIAVEEPSPVGRRIPRAGRPAGAITDASSSRLESVRSRRSGSLRLPSIVPIRLRLPWRAMAPHQTSPIDGAEVRKLLGMMWFRTVLARLSRDWRDRVLEVLIDEHAGTGPCGEAWPTDHASS